MNDEIRYRRKKEENKKANQEQQFTFSQKEKYILQNAKQGIGMGTTAMQSLGAVNARLDTVDENIGKIDRYMSTYTKEQDDELQALRDKVNALIDLIVTTGIEITVDVAKTLGLEEEEKSVKVVEEVEEDVTEDPEE